ncbi:hypothetical protein L202_03431 [Cryptococcus amylolentus CBS 6039]|uniref:Zn(2)-C6 fungal-type domain-containing protein n=1 Tax=Cryptococcus amylolentus CBS 6039 TaxID=1295533 RepID=A0A1E3HSW7_9TREE|nr:hypothetical protein L202_03431 [Cryptococcus amylolentus CBS 6039]ODN79453.1 hypothetical protein L202_03431 [Cryptococcus amylolentus CBS 6039]
MPDSKPIPSTSPDTQQPGSMQPPALPLKKTSLPPGEGGGKKGGVKIVKGEKAGTGRQSFSCAECRRLKLKCSREWPCTSCEKRGCAQICPQGVMQTGKGKRLILADTAELHERISELELALSQAHAKTTESPHPLLASPYLFSPRESPSRPRPSPSASGLRNGSIPGEDRLEGAFGTLTMGQEGQATYVGSFAGSEYLREEAVDEDEKNAADGPLRTPPATARTAPRTLPSQEREEDFWPGLGLHASLMAGGEVKWDLNSLRAELPDYEIEGRVLVAAYWENVNWQYQPIPRVMFENDHILNAYDTVSPVNAHKLACVFLVMALGVMYDLHRPPFDPRGEQLFSLGRACISTVGIEHASPATVQALLLMGTYILNDKRGNGGEVFWPILGTAVKIAQGLGLHRDGSNYGGLSQYEIEERRQTWWEVVTYDRLQAICFARPCSTSFKWSDTKLPETPELIGDEAGFHRAKYQFMEFMERVIEIQTQVDPVSFVTVAQLDQEVREFKKNLPELLMPNVPIQDLPLGSQIHPHLVIQRFGIRLQIAQTRLLLNRPLFARALQDSPTDPSHSAKLGESFVALFESAQEIVLLVKYLVIYHPSLIARWWFFWFHAFSAAVCLSAITIHAPYSAFANPSFHAMSVVCDISAAAREGCRAKRGLPILLRLRVRAHDALAAATAAAAHQSRSKTAKGHGSSGEDDDLSHLAGSGKLRRVQVPYQRRLSGGSGPQGNGLEGTPSPGSGGSIGTASTLVESGLYESIIPPAPVETPLASRILPSSANSHQQRTAASGSGSSWLSNEPMGPFSTDMTPTPSFAARPQDPNLLARQSSNWVHFPSSAPVDSSNFSGSGVSPEFDPSTEMDISAAFGMNSGMHMGMSLDNYSIRHYGAGEPLVRAIDIGMTGMNVPGPMQHGMDTGAATEITHERGAEAETLGFDFAAFVDNMGL